MAAQRSVGAAPLLLALESSGRTPSVALLRGEQVLAEVEGRPGRSGAESLLPGIDAVLRRAGLELDAVQAFAVSIGPGSFTGLRVGVATLKGLAFDNRRPVVPVASLAALARGAALEAAQSDAPVVALADARRGEVYAAGWRITHAGRRARAVEPEEGVYTPEELVRVLPAGALLVGEGVALCGERLRELAPAPLRLGPAREAHARDVGALALTELARGGGVPAAELAPRYLRRAEAEVKRTGQRFE